MRQVPAHFDTVWQNGDFTGVNKATRRVTIQRPMMRLDSFDMMTTFRRVPAVYGDVAAFNPYPSGIDPTKGDPVTNVYASYLFQPPEPPRELPNVTSISWSRSTDVDVAECTIEAWNVNPTEIGINAPDGLDRPGYFSPSRGTSPFSSRWVHEPNEWSNLMMPDNLLRTYEGWGTDNPEGVGPGAEGYVSPENDTRVIQTGLWVIDQVSLSALGSITITCRDTGRLLLDHQVMIPVAPEDFYPPSFKDWSDKITVSTQETRTRVVSATSPVNYWHAGSGNDRWPESSYVGARVHGHSSTHAFDGNPGSYWLSVGNDRPTYPSSYEYLDIGVAGDISEVRFTTVGSGYNCYISVHTPGGWVGGPTMPYRRDGRGRYDEGLPYVAYAGGLAGEGEHVIHLGGTIQGADLVRVWLGNVQDFGLPGSKYRAAIREVSVWGPQPRVESYTVTESRQVDLKPGPAGSNPGRCQDYTDIVKLFCAWGGLYWPSDAYLYDSDGNIRYLQPARADKVLGDQVPGRVWGDFQDTGTAPVAEILASTFDKKSLLDGIRYVAETLGFMFHIDETGGAQWRLPNVWSRGNWVSGTAATPGRTPRVITIDERRVIMNLDSTIQSRNVREGIFVANPVGHYAALVPGFNPNPTGLRRVGGWTDQYFNSIDEARVTADLIAVRAMFRYRTDRFSIPAHPALQIDDQVRIFERVTSEGYYHYVTGISSSNSQANGQWTYALQTHWLGDDPDGQWAFDQSSLSSNTLSYVDSLHGGPEFVRAGLGA